jgi:WD40 repeat protein
MPNDVTVITGTGRGSHTIRVWDVVSGLCSYIIRSHTDSITRINVLDNLLISGSHDQTVCIYDLAAGIELQRLEGHTNYPYLFSFSEDKTCMAVACSGGDIKIWRLADS